MSSALIKPFLFEFDIESLPDDRLISYVMPGRAYEAIKSAQGKEPHHAIDLRGLEPILAWAAPCVDVAMVRSVDPSNPAKSLHFWIYLPDKPLEEIKTEVLNAIMLWLGLTVPQHADQVFKMLTDERSAKTAWQTIEISRVLSSNHGCVVPKDGRAFDLLTVFACKQMEAKTLTVQDQPRGILLATGPRKSLYSGKTLIAYAPRPIERQGKTHGHWTEVFSVAALTTPERKRIRVAVGVSIRNYVRIHPRAFQPGVSRHLDVFVRPDPHLSGNADRVRALTIPLRLNDLNAIAEGKSNECSPTLEVLRRVFSLAGVDERSVVNDERELPSFIDRNVSVFPRAGSIHGDRFLPGATGIGMQDRKDYFDFVHAALSPAGFEPVELGRRRYSRRVNLEPLLQSDEPTVELQKAILSEVRRLNNSDTLNLAVLSPRLNSEIVFENALESILGTPLSNEEGNWSYACGLRVAFHHVLAGPFATRLEDPKKALKDLPSDLRYQKRIQIEREAARDEGRKRAQELQTYLANHFQKPADDVWLAIVEMDEKLKEEPLRDPYQLVYTALASSNFLPQVVLYNADTIASGGTDEDDESSYAYKVPASLRDLLRSLGVPFVRPESAYGDGALQGWWVVNLNADSGTPQPGARSERLVVPIAVDFKDGALSACVPNRHGARSWKPYARVVLDLLSGNIEDIGKLRPDQVRTYVSQFFASITTDQSEQRVTFSDANNLRQFVNGISNGGLNFGKLDLGAIGSAAPLSRLTDAGSTSFIRLTTDPDKSPSYWVSVNTSGITQGLFAEPGSERTFWISRGLPVALQKSASVRNANKQSRYAGTEQARPNLKARRFPSLTEVCVVVQAHNRTADELVALTRKAMTCHATTDESTILPFPLHEARLLAEALR